MTYENDKPDYPVWEMDTSPDALVAFAESTKKQWEEAAGPVKEKYQRDWIKICRCGHSGAWHTPNMGVPEDAYTHSRYDTDLGRPGTPALAAMGAHRRGCWAILLRQKTAGYGLPMEPTCECNAWEPWIEVKGLGGFFRYRPKPNLPSLAASLRRVAEVMAEGSTKHPPGLRWLVPPVCHRCHAEGPAAEVLPYFDDDGSVQLGCATCRWGRTSS